MIRHFYFFLYLYAQYCHNFQTMFIRWSDIFKTHIEIIDEQHFKLIAIINELYSAYYKGTYSESINEIIGRLTECSVNHFDTEEKILDEIKFPAKENHILDHRRFKKVIDQFSSSNDIQSDIAFYELFEFLNDWFMNHILVKDREFIPLYNKHFSKKTN